MQTAKGRLLSCRGSAALAVLLARLFLTLARRAPARLFVGILHRDGVAAARKLREHLLLAARVAAARAAEPAEAGHGRGVAAAAAEELAELAEEASALEALHHLA